MTLADSQRAEVQRMIDAHASGVRRFALDRLDSLLKLADLVVRGLQRIRQVLDGVEHEAQSIADALTPRRPGVDTLVRKGVPNPAPKVVDVECLVFGHVPSPSSVSESPEGTAPAGHSRPAGACGRCGQ